MNILIQRAALVVSSLALVSTFAFAHMKVAKTAPEEGATLNASPDTVRIWYTQEPDRAVSKMKLRGAGVEMELDVKADSDKSLTASLDAALSDGNYTVSWQTAGDDGHIQKGEFSFTVKSTH